MLSQIEVVAEASNQLTAFATCRNGRLLRTTTMGRDWMSIASVAWAGQPRILAVSPTFSRDQSMLITTTNGLLLLSGDGGGSWREIDLGGGRATAMTWGADGIVVGFEDGAVATFDQETGALRQMLREPMPSEVTALAWLPHRSTRKQLAIGTAHSGLRILEAGVDSFFDVLHGGFGKEYITSISPFVHNVQTELLVTTWNNGVYHSPDGGTQWKLRNSNLVKDKQADEYGRPHFSNAWAVDRSLFLLVGFNGLYVSRSLEDGWTKIDVTLNHIVSVGASKLTEGRYAVAATTYGGGVLISEDRGNTWSIRNTGMSFTRLGPVAFSPAYDRDGVIIIGTYGHIYVSRDRSRRWTDIRLPHNQGISKFLTKFLFGYEDHSNQKKYGIYRFTQKFLDPYYFDSYLPPAALWIEFSPDFDRDGVVFAGMYPNGLMKSSDGGRSFRLIWGAGGRRVVSVAVSAGFRADSTLFAAADDALYRSRDGGESWEAIAAGDNLAGATLAISPAFPSDATLFAGSDSGLYRIRFDSAEPRIEKEDDIASVSAIAISPNFDDDRRIFVQERGGDLLLCQDVGGRLTCKPSLLRSSGGEFTHIIGFDRAQLIAPSPVFTRDRTIFGGSGHDLLKSKDGGLTWTPIDRPRRYEAETALYPWFHIPTATSGDWRVLGNREFSGAAAIVTGEPGARFTFEFVGTGVALRGPRGPKYGAIAIVIDGELVDVVDLAADADALREILFEVKGLPIGLHSLTIESLRSKTEGFDGVDVGIDSIDVYR